MKRRSNLQVGPVRWIFIKSPIPRQPYNQIRKIYELELVNSKAKNKSEISKDVILIAREKTRQILRQKQRKETIQNIIAFSIILLLAILGIIILCT